MEYLELEKITKELESKNLISKVYILNALLNMGDYDIREFKEHQKNNILNTIYDIYVEFDYLYIDGLIEGVHDCYTKIIEYGANENYDSLYKLLYNYFK